MGITRCTDSGGRKETVRGRRRVSRWTPLDRIRRRDEPDAQEEMYQIDYRQDDNETGSSLVLTRFHEHSKTDLFAIGETAQQT